VENETSFLVGLITSALLLIMGCSVLFATRNWLALIEEYSEHPYRLLVPGLATVVFGLIVVFNHNIWTGGWVVAVSVAGWLILIKGLSFLFSPGIVKLHEKFPRSMVKMAMRVGGVILILLSIMLLLTLTGRA
jgi:hypothetical protein